jgi:hypothetical protein
MKDLIVIGASGLKCPAQVQTDIADALRHRFGDQNVFYADDRETAFRILEGYPGDFQPVIAYAPGVFGDAAAGGRLSPRLATAEPQVILTSLRLIEVRDAVWDEKDGVRATADQPDLVRTDDPRRYLEAALAMLRVNVALNVLIDTHLDVLEGFLDGGKF